MIVKDLVSDKSFRFNKWKNKAKILAKNANALRKRLKELNESRDKIRLKKSELISKISDLKKNDKDLENIENKTNIASCKPKHHSFRAITIQVLLTITLQGGTKFRTLEKDGKIRSQIIPDYNEVPSHVTIRNWVLKVGYYELTRPKEKANDWIILLDHSIQFGQDKIFTVLGIRKKDFLELKRPLQYTDLEPLLEKSMKTSNGILIASEIDDLKKDIGNIIYAIGDYGPDLKKGLRLSEISHIHDLSHLISIEIEKIFDKNERFQKLKKEMSLMRNKFIQTNVASVIPPKQRKKSEYQSFDKIVKWAENALNLLNNTLNDTDKIKELRKEFDNATLDRIKKELTWIDDFKE
ncbi:MAG: hypothetical protein KAI81_02615, partial [Candidatus Marinimicrobia bacterium]|nr:hypothetical protein [Candidatus Neomarinimicrobiota bacterium]